MVSEKFNVKNKPANISLSENINNELSSSNFFNSNFINNEQLK